MNRRNRLLLIGLLVVVGVGLAAYAWLTPHSAPAEKAARGGSSGAMLLLLMVVALSARRRRREKEEEGRNG